MAEKKPKSEGKQPSSYKELSTRRDALEKKKQDFFDKNDIESVVEIGKQLEVVNKLIEKRNKLNRETIYDSKEYDDVLKSIGGKIDKQSNGYKEIEKGLAVAADRADAMAQQISQIPTSQKEIRDTALESAAAYKKGTGEIQNAFASLMENKDANIDIAKVVQKQIDKQKGYITELEKAGDVAAEVLKTNKDNLDVLEATKKAYVAASKDMKAMGKIGEKLNSSPLGGMINQGLGITKSLGITKEGNVGDLTTSLIKKRGLAATGGKAASGLMSGIGAIARFAGPAALIAGAAYGIFKWVDGGGPQKLSAAFKMIGGDKLMDAKSIDDKAASLEGTEEFRKINAKYNYIKPLEERQTREKELFDYQKSNTIAMIEFENSLVKDELGYQIGLKKDAITFGHNQAMQTMEAEAARRKSLFLTGMNMYKTALSVSERALNAIGSSTDAVLESVKEFGAQLGTTLKNQIEIATSAAGLGKLFQTGGTEILKMSKNFRLMDKSSAKTAFNNVAGLKAFAKLNEINPGELFKQMADATEDVMKYSNMTTSQYATQAILLSNMNISMKDMAAASGTMVLNYKDSIKSEMSLSAMLGRNVNLSEVRARLMSGDMAGGASALKSALGGMDIGSMNAFQKQELSKATGMGVEQLMSLTQSKGGGVKGTLAEAAALKTGADIAKGALKMDISLAGQRLGMEQAQRKEMMKFEQRERMIMMQLEQAQKLKMLEVEAYFRVKYTKELEMSQEKQMAAAKHLEEMGSGIMMGGGKNLMDQAFRGLDKGSAGYSQANLLNNSIAGMIQGGQIDSGDMRLAEYYNAQFELAEIHKKHPEKLAAALKDTYDTIFKEESEMQKKQKQQEYNAFVREKSQLTMAIEYLNMVQTRGTVAMNTAQEAEFKEQNALYASLGPTMKEAIASGGTAILSSLSERLKIVNGGIAEGDPLQGTGYYLTNGGKGFGKRPWEAGYSGAPFLNTTPFDSTTQFNWMGGTGISGPGSNFGQGGGAAPPPGPVVKVPNNYIVDTSSVVNAINALISANAVHAKSFVDSINVVATGVLTGYDNMPSRTFEEITKLNTISTNGYTEMLRRTDVTNTLLDTLIGVTNDVSAKPINISGKRVSDVMTNVKNRVYGITGAK